MRVWLLALLLLLLGLAADAYADPTIADLVRDLGAKARADRNRARDRLIERQDPACIEPILAALPGFDFAARTGAQRVLEAFPPSNTRRPLRTLLRSKDLELRALAAASLFRAGDESGLAVGLEALKDGAPHGPGHWPVLNRMYVVRHPEVTAAIREGLPRFSGHTLRFALIHHWLVEDHHVLPSLRELARAPDLDVRLSALALQYRLARAEVLPDLRKALADPAGSKLGLQDALRFFSNGPTPPRPFLDAVCDRLDADRRPSVRILILEELAAWRDVSILSRTEIYVGNANPEVARAALGAVVRLAGPSSRASIARGLRHADARIRILSAEALYLLDDRTGLPAVVDALKSARVVDRREAARALGTFRMRRVVPPLLDALEDRDGGVRRLAWQSLQEVIEALFPYRRLDWKGLGDVPGAPADVRQKTIRTLRAWWRARTG